VIVRPATPADAEAVLAVTRAAFGGYDLTPPSGAMRETVASVAEDLSEGGGAVARGARGVMGCVRWSGTRVRTVRRLAVEPARQGGGIGRALIDAAVEPGVVALRAGVRHQLPDNAGRFRHWGFSLLARHDFWDAYELPLPRPVEAAADMRALGVALAGLLAAGDLVLLTGPLGAGKTVLAQGIGVGLGVTERLTSPTFVLAREHVGRVPVVHVDAYRLGGLAELDDLDLDTPADSAVTVVEWGGGIAETLADGHLLVEITRSDDPGDDVRTVRLTGVGPAWDGRREGLTTLDW
jgi:tRNA threonylcarbamoyladenosine biosynthesis protein TsaE